ncbi:histidine kinase, partial [Staphylococcus aureus]
VNAQKDIQNLLSEYANRQEIGEIRFIDKDQIIIATTKQSNRSLINQKANDSSVQKALSLGQSNDHLILKDYGGGKDRVWGYNIPVKIDKKGIGNIFIETKNNKVYKQIKKIKKKFIFGKAILLLIKIILGF